MLNRNRHVNGERENGKKQMGENVVRSPESGH